MENFGIGAWVAIVVAVGVIGILLGYWLGAKLGGHNTGPMRELNREHTEYKEDVREHFAQVSATMSRMVDDYREMYQHVAKGAEKLADMHHETVIEPPPKPEAITQGLHGEDDESGKTSEADTTAKPADATSAPQPETPAKNETSATNEKPAPGQAGATTQSSETSTSKDKAAKTTQKPAATSAASDAESPLANTEASDTSPSDDTQELPGRNASEPASSQKERPKHAAMRAAAEDAASKR